MLQVELDVLNLPETKFDLAKLGAAESYRLGCPWNWKVLLSFLVRVEVVGMPHCSWYEAGGVIRN